MLRSIVLRPSRWQPREALRVGCRVSVFVVATSLGLDVHAIDQNTGVKVTTCQYAETVRVGSTCTGVWVGQNTVITAAHCREDGLPTWVTFGDVTTTAMRFKKVNIIECTFHPSGTFTTVNGTSLYNGIDIMVCKLAADAPNVPVIPPMVPNGCERDWLAAKLNAGGEPSTFVGLGCEACYACTPCTSNNKRFVAPGNPVDFRLEAQVTHHGTSTKLRFDSTTPTGVVRSGDSGGPAYVRMPDFSYRLVGVAHGSAIDDYFEAVPSWLSWIEAMAAEDLTPCHDRNSSGSWVFHGGSGCQDALVKRPELTGRAWSNACQPSASQRSAFYGGGKSACAGWLPPVIISGSTQLVAPETSLQESVDAVQAVEGTAMEPSSCGEVQAFVQDVVEDSAYDAFLAPESAIAERPVEDAYVELGCPTIPG